MNLRIVSQLYFFFFFNDRSDISDVMLLNCDDAPLVTFI